MFTLSPETRHFLQQCQADGDKKIVFTNGCFDILHAGHVTYLKEARALGDVLVVGLNSDSSVKKLKGDKRPIISQQERKYLLENLKWVDCVEIFDEDTPLQLIQAVRPHILVKGGDWKEEQIVGSHFVKSLGGEVKNLIFVDGLSTTNVIQKILNSYQ
jgi:rfaE bifunctional protein nucleotidyltransferase chain/domain